jgi:hypothetical protein
MHLIDAEAGVFSPFQKKSEFEKYGAAWFHTIENSHTT